MRLTDEMEGLQTPRIVDLRKNNWGRVDFGISFDFGLVFIHF